MTTAFNAADKHEMARAFVCALSARGGELLAPVSTLTIQNELNRHNVQYRATEVLHDLGEIGDLQCLERGYWLPTPSRLIAFGENDLLLSGLPTPHLEKHYSIAVEVLGLGRLVHATDLEADELPIESPSSWANSPPSTTQWALEYIASLTWGDAFGLDQAEIYRSWHTNNRGRWIAADQLRINRDETVLARHRAPDMRANYYLVQTRRGRITAAHELSRDFDIARLMCALRSRDGDPTRFRFWKLDDARYSGFSVEILPKSEDRMFRATARLPDQNRRFISGGIVLTKMTGVITTVLEALGAKLEA